MAFAIKFVIKAPEAIILMQQNSAFDPILEKHRIQN